MRAPIFSLLLLLAIPACAETHVDGKPLSSLDKNNQIGWMHGNCLAIKNASLPTQSELTLILLDEPQTIGKGKVIEKVSSGDKCYSLMDDRRAVNIDSGFSFYLIDTNPAVKLAIGLVGESINKQKYYFDYCATTEGINFRIKDHEKVIWSEYYYLGYESEATCKDDHPKQAHHL